MAKGTLNKVQLIGRLGKDPELNESGKVATLSVATNYRQKSKDGEWETKTEWNRVKALGKLADVAKDYLSKGKLVYIEGELRTSSWEDKEGNKRYATDIIANQMDMLGSKDDNGGGSAPSKPAPKKSTAPAPAAPAAEDDDDDDLPF